MSTQCASVRQNLYKVLSCCNKRAQPSTLSLSLIFVLKTTLFGWWYVIHIYKVGINTHSHTQTTYQKSRGLCRRIQPCQQATTVDYSRGRTEDRLCEPFQRRHSPWVDDALPCRIGLPELINGFIDINKTVARDDGTGVGIKRKVAPLLSAFKF